jgi:hypothetical protein
MFHELIPSPTLLSEGHILLHILLLGPLIAKDEDLGTLQLTWNEKYYYIGLLLSGLLFL